MEEIRKDFPIEGNGFLLRENEEIKKFNKIFFKKEDERVGSLAEGKSLDNLPKIPKVRGLIMNEKVNEDWLHEPSLILVIKTKDNKEIRTNDVYFNDDEFGNIKFDAKII